MKILYIYYRLVFCAWWLENELWDHCSLTGSYSSKLSNSQILLEKSEQDCSFQQDGATAHTANTTSFLQDFLHDYSVRCGLWPHNLYTSHHPDFCVNLLKKESTAIIQEARKWGAFSASAVIKHFILCISFLATYIK